MKAVPSAAVILLWALWLNCPARQGLADGSTEGTAPRRQNIYRFDFETVRPLADDELLPVGWEKVAVKEDSPDFDLDHFFYNEARLARENGNHYLEMTLHKGRVSYQTISRMKEKREDDETEDEMRFIPVNPAKSYTLSAKIRTEGFEQPDRPTMAYVAMMWFDRAANAAIGRYQDGAPIIFRTPPVICDTGGGWREVRLAVDTVPPGARFLRLRCTLEGKGIRARAMFDDVTLAEEPRVRLDPGRPVPIFAGEEKIEIVASLNGLAPGRYSERIQTENLDGDILQAETRDLGVKGEGEVLRRCEAEARTFGAFRLRYTIRDADGGEVAARSIVLARVPQDAPLKETERYGLCLRFFEHPYAVLGDYVRASCAGSIKNELWGEAAEQEEFIRFAGAMRRESVATVGVLGRSPGDLSRLMGFSVPMEGHSLFNQPEKQKHGLLWDYLKRDLAKWTDVLDAVQPARDFNAPYEAPVSGIISAYGGAMDRPLSSATLVFPASASPGAAWPEGARVVSLSVPASLTWRELAQRLAEKPETSTVWVSLALPPQGAGQIDDMIRKMAVCLAANTGRIFLPLESPDGLIRVIAFPNESAEPTAAFAAFRFITQMTDGAERVEDVSLPGVRIYLFEKEDESIAVAWSEEGETSLRVCWGGGLRTYDAFGNSSALPCVNGETTISGLAESPRIIRGINPRLMKTWRSLRFLKGSILSAVEEQRIEVAIENRFDREIQGTISLEFGDELRHLQPRRTKVEFRLAPGQTWSSGDAFMLKPSISDTLGVKNARAVVAIISEDGVFALNKALTAEIVPSNLSLKVVRVAREQSGETVIRVAARNEGDMRASATLYAGAGDGASGRRRISIPRLEPGEQAEAEFRIRPDAGPAPRRIWLGLREVDGRRFANIYVNPGEIKDVSDK